MKREIKSYKRNTMKRILFSTLLLAWLLPMTMQGQVRRKIIDNGGSRPQPPVTVQADGMPTASVTFTATK